MIDPKKETLKRLTELNFYRPLSLQSRTRYALKGMKAVDGRYVKLEVTKIGSALMSSQEAVDRLIEAVNTPAVQPATATRGQRAAQNEAAKRVLANA